MQEHKSPGVSPEAAEEIGTLLRRVNRGLRQRMVESGSPGSTVSQLMTMKLVSHHPGLTLTELSRFLGLSNPTVSGIVDRLEREGLVTRQPDAADRRVLRLGLTAKGEEQRERWASVYRDAMAGILAHLTPAELTGLKTSLTALARALENISGQPLS